MLCCALSIFDADKKCLKLGLWRRASSIYQSTSCHGPVANGRNRKDSAGTGEAEKITG